MVICKVRCEHKESIHLKLIECFVLLWWEDHFDIVMFQVVLMTAKCEQPYFMGLQYVTFLCPGILKHFTHKILC